MATVSQTVTIFTVTSVTCAFATVFGALRLVSRARIVGKLNPDDWLIVGAWVLATALSAIIWLNASTGKGLGSGLSEAKNLAGLRAYTTLYSLSHAASKLSVLTYYLTLSRTSAVFRNSTIATMVLVVVSTLAVTIGISVSKGDYVTFWNTSTKIYVAASPSNILTDLLIPLLPIPTIQRQMNLPLRQKWIVFGTLGCGGLLAIVDIIRVVYQQKALSALKTGAILEYSDFATKSVVWSIADINLSVAVTCVPAMKPLIMRLVPKLLRSESSKAAMSHIRSRLQSGLGARSSQPLSQKTRSQDVMSDETLQVSQISFNAMFAVPTAEEAGTASFAPPPEPVLVKDTEVIDQSEGTNIDFVKLRQRNTLHHVPANQSVKLLWRTTLIYLLIGFSSSFMMATTTEARSQKTISPAISLAHNAVFYGAYLLAPLGIAYPVLGRFSFKGCSMAGLLTFAVACLVFWPSAVLGGSPTAIAISYFLLGCGASVMETKANFYTFLAGPPQLAAARILIMQGIQAVGTTIAPLVVSGIESRIQAVEWAYLVLACFAFILVFHYQISELQEMKDEEIEEDFKETNPEKYELLCQHKTLVYITVATTVLGIFAYVGAQENGHNSLASILRTSGWTIDVLHLEAMSRGIFAISRFLAAVICLWVKPRTLLLFCALGGLAFSITTTQFTGRIGIALLQGERICSAPIFPLGFVLACHSMGKHTRLAACLAVSGSVGGMLFPCVQYAMVRVMGESISYAQVVTVAAFAVVLFWAIWINMLPITRMKVDGQVNLPEEDTHGPAEETTQPGFMLNFLTSAISHDDVGFGTGNTLRKLSAALSLRGRGLTKDAETGVMEMRPYGRLESPSSSLSSGSPNDDNRAV